MFDRRSQRTQDELACPCTRRTFSLCRSHSDSRHCPSPFRLGTRGSWCIAEYHHDSRTCCTCHPEAVQFIQYLLLGRALGMTHLSLFPVHDHFSVHHAVSAGAVCIRTPAASSIIVWYSALQVSVLTPAPHAPIVHASWDRVSVTYSDCAPIDHDVAALETWTTERLVCYTHTFCYSLEPAAGNKKLP